MSRQAQQNLFDTEPHLPPGFYYQPGFLSEYEHVQLRAAVEAIPLEPMVMRGVPSVRRVAHFGWRYGAESHRIDLGPPIPPAFLPLRARLAAAIRLDPDDLVELLVTRYDPGAGIGWHRDAPTFGLVAAVSLGGSCRLRFRTLDGRVKRELQLAPRSMYVIDKESRSEWQHSIPPHRELRYSLTYRTLRPWRFQI